MEEIETLNSLLAKHPEWADLPITISDSVGELTYLGANAFVFDLIDDDGQKVLVFSGN